MTSSGKADICLGIAHANFPAPSGNVTRGRGLSSCKATGLVNPGTDCLFVRKVYFDGRTMKGV